MKAAQISQYGDSEVIQIQEVPEVVPQPGQVLVDVHAASINPFDWKLRSGVMKEQIPLTFPVTLGGDFSGVVAKVGDKVADYQPGDEVYGSALVLGAGSGALAEQAIVGVGSIARKPAAITHEEAAALVLVGVSAVQALDQLGLAGGHKLLIQGGAGGIGSAAIQYAKHLGVYIATTVRGADAGFVKSLGADEVIDYEKQDFTQLVKGYDAVFDTTGNAEAYAKSYAVLKPGGRLISMTTPPDEKLAKQYGVTALMQSTQVNTQSLERLSQLVEAGAIKAQIDKTFPLEQTADAFAYLETGHPKGKVVVKVK